MTLPGRLTAVILLLLQVACASTHGRAPSSRVTLASIEPAGKPMQYTLQLVLHNPGHTILPVAGLDYRLVINGVDFAWGASRQSVDVPPQSDAVFDIDVQGILPEQQDPIGRSPRLSCHLSGSVKLSDARGSLPFVYDGELVRPSPVAP
jgi:hypothetical protein